MRALGSAGGKASVRSRNGVDVGDGPGAEKLRAQALRVYADALNSDDPKERQWAAKLVLSYGPTKPPSDAPETSEGWNTQHRPISSGAVLKILADAGAFDDYEDAELRPKLEGKLATYLSTHHPLDGRKVTSISDVIDCAVETGNLAAIPGLAAAIRRAYASLPEGDEAAAKFTAEVEDLAARAKEPAPASLHSPEELADLQHAWETELPEGEDE